MSNYSMLRLILLFVGYGNLLYGKSICTKEKMDTNQILGEVYGFIKPPSKEPKVVDKVEYLFDGKPIEEDEVIAKSQLYIECAPDRTPYDFDKPLPNGWLYPIFYEDQRWKKYFDTGTEEYWVFPNVHCNEKRRLTAMSWMRSGRHESHKNNGDMHRKFKEHTPPFATGNVNDGGVYCQWDGWLYSTGKYDYKKWFDTGEDDETFTLVNVYCRNNRVVFLHKELGGHGLNKPLNKDEIDRPFENLEPPDKKNDTLVRCNWKGWLYKAMILDDTWQDNGKKRWTYERYFIIKEKGLDDSDKKNNHAIHGRVMNPYCSQAKPSSTIGVITAVRAYCFYPSSGRWHREKKSMCDDLGR